MIPDVILADAPQRTAERRLPAPLLGAAAEPLHGSGMPTVSGRIPA
jgi:hypothetical protein